MNPGNIALYLTGAVFAFMFWFALGPTPKVAPSSMPYDIRSAISTGRPVMLEFSATWCGPCQMVKPLVHELAAEVQGRAEVVMIDIDQRKDLAHQYDVHAVPTFIVLKGGVEVERVSGGIPKFEMKRMLGL